MFSSEISEKRDSLNSLFTRHIPFINEYSLCGTLSHRLSPNTAKVFIHYVWYFTLSAIVLSSILIVSILVFLEVLLKKRLPKFQVSFKVPIFSSNFLDKYTLLSFLFNF